MVSISPSRDILDDVGTHSSIPISSRNLEEADPPGITRNNFLLSSITNYQTNDSPPAESRLNPPPHHQPPLPQSPLPNSPLPLSQNPSVARVYPTPTQEPKHPDKQTTTPDNENNETLDSPLISLQHNSQETSHQNIAESLLTEHKKTSNTSDKVNNRSFEHVLLPVERLLEVVNEHLGVCSECDEGQLKLVRSNSVHLAHQLKIHCELCEKNTEALRSQLNRQSNKKKSNDRKTNKSIVNRKHYLKRKLKHSKQLSEKNKIDAIQVNTKGFLTGSSNIKSVNFDLNLRCMLSCYWLGTGSKDLVKLFSMLGFGSMSAFERCFTRNEQMLNEGFIHVGKQIIRRSMHNEIIQTIKNRMKHSNKDSIQKVIYDFENQQYDKVKHTIGNIGLTVSYDMGWQKRAGGRVYDSLSGHAYMIGCATGKVINMGVLCKKCSTCRTFNKQNREPPLHSCPINHENSSGSMESSLCVRLVNEVHDTFDELVRVEALVTDDDTTLRKHCRAEEEGGKLRAGVPTPRFLADPGHRIKVIGKALFGLVTKTKTIDEVRTIDVLRLKKYFSLYISQNKNKGFKQFKKNINAPVEHLFDNHCFCDSSWCWAKSVDDFMHENIVQTVNSQSTNNELVQQNDIVTGANTLNTNIISQEDDMSLAIGPIKGNLMELDVEGEWVDALNLHNTLNNEGRLDSENKGDDSEGDSSVEIDDDDDDDLSVEDAAENLYVEEMNYESAICENLNNYGIEQTIFTHGELEEMKQKEQALMERKERGYYRSKTTHYNAYMKINDALKKFLTDENLRMIHHPHNTQSNEALNKSVSAYAPKHKTYSLTKSLEARVTIAASTQIDGYYNFWREAYDHFRLYFDDAFAANLRTLDRNKNRKRVLAASKEGKRKRLKVKHTKLTDTHKQDMEDRKRDLIYQSGVAMRDAQKVVKRSLAENERNPPGTPTNKLRCKFFHVNYCRELGHKSARHKCCFMFGKTKQERDLAEKEILKLLGEKYLENRDNSGKYAQSGIPHI